MEFAFHVYNSIARTGASMALTRLLKSNGVPPVILCIGSDLAVGDSLGPLTGSMLYRKNLCGAYLYGTLRSPVTAKEIGYLKEFLARTHPNSKVIAVDAAVGEPSEIGLVKLSEGPVKPGSGANKRLGEVGDVSVLGIIAEKGFSYSALNLTRLNTVYCMAELIAGAIEEYLQKTCSVLDNYSQNCL